MSVQFDYADQMGGDMIILAVVLTFSVMAPLITFFGLIYYALVYLGTFTSPLFLYSQINNNNTIAIINKKPTGTILFTSIPLSGIQEAYSFGASFIS